MSTTPAAMRDLLARFPADQAQVLRPDPNTVTEIIATRITDPAWLAEQVRLCGATWNVDDQHVLATLWWYSASTTLVTPALASLVATGTALSPRLEDTVLHYTPSSRTLSSRTPSSRLTGSHSTAILGPDLDQLGAALETTLTTVITALGAFTGGRRRPLWAIATDAIANRLLWAGQALGRVREATDLAAPVIAAAGLQLLPPRYVDVESSSLSSPAEATGRTPSVRRFVRRSSCCLIYRIPGEGLCTSCPGRDPAERADLLSHLASYI
jgi:ferric iron reductase protein FhuF